MTNVLRQWLRYHRLDAQSARLDPSATAQDFVNYMTIGRGSVWPVLFPIAAWTQARSSKLK